MKRAILAVVLVILTISIGISISHLYVSDNSFVNKWIQINYNMTMPNVKSLLGIPSQVGKYCTIDSNKISKEWYSWTYKYHWNIYYVIFDEKGKVWHFSEYK